MESLWSHLSFAVSMHDPFAGTLVWGSAGLAVAIVWAAFVGIGLHALRRVPPLPRRPRTQQSNHEDWRDAA